MQIDTQGATALEAAGCHWVEWPVGHGNILFIHLLRPNWETLVCMGTKDNKHNTHRRGIAGWSKIQMMPHSRIDMP